ncbi:MAG: DUF309 domain-containing protein [Nitrospirae bacterium]|nr:MAG: DUF309 domain-containing protein [Nitrospirota bacterium]
MLRHHRTALEEGVRLYNAGHYYDAHEVLEEAWRELPRGSEPRRFFQALIHLAVAAHHHERGRGRPAGLQYRKVLEKLAGLPPRYAGLEVTALRALARQGLAAVEGEPLGPRPQAPLRLEAG